MKRKLRRPVAVVLFVVIVAVLLIVDRSTKILAVGYLGGGVAKPFIPQILDFYLTFNQGAAFGVLEGGGMIFLTIALLISLGIFIYMIVSKSHKTLEVIALSMIVAGALGNAFDRIQIGMVIDFVRTLFIDFPIFNVADSCITIGIILLFIYIILDSRNSAKKNLELPDTGFDEEKKNDA